MWHRVRVGGRGLAVPCPVARSRSAVGMCGFVSRGGRRGWRARRRVDLRVHLPAARARSHCAIKLASEARRRQADPGTHVWREAAAAAMSRRGRGQIKLNTHPGDPLGSGAASHRDLATALRAPLLLHNQMQSNSLLACVLTCAHGVLHR